MNIDLKSFIEGQEEPQDSKLKGIFKHKKEIDGQLLHHRN